MQKQKKIILLSTTNKKEKKGSNSMKKERVEVLKRDLDRTLKWTLLGGNDPDDQGDVVAAVRELGEIIEEILDSITDKEGEK